MGELYPSAGSSASAPDTRARSIVKSFTWRFLATLATILLVYAFTGEWTVSFGVGVIEVALKLLLYFLHERAWTRVRWGLEQGRVSDRASL